MIWFSPGTRWVGEADLEFDVEVAADESVVAVPGIEADKDPVLIGRLASGYGSAGMDMFGGSGRPR